MGKTITAIFDGRVLRPESPAELEPDTRYLVTIEMMPSPTEEEDAWDLLERLSGALEAPEDWAAEHDHYLYGTAKRGAQVAT